MLFNWNETSMFLLVSVPVKQNKSCFNTNTGRRFGFLKLQTHYQTFWEGVDLWEELLANSQSSHVLAIFRSLFSILDSSEAAFQRYFSKNPL